MDIPAVVRWALLAFAGLNLLLALRALNLVRRAGRGHRADPAFDAVDHALGTVLMGALALPGDHWLLVLVALVLLGPVILWKGVRDFRTRRAEKAKAAATEAWTPAADAQGSATGAKGSATEAKAPDAES